MIRSKLMQPARHFVAMTLAVFGTCGAIGALSLEPAVSADSPFVVGFTDILSGANAAIGTPVLAGARVYFVSGGSEGIETALKIARSYQLACGRPRRTQQYRH